MALALEILDFADDHVMRTRFYFRDQMSRAAMSIPANIAEGNGRSTPLDYAAFLDRAHGSLFELDTWLHGAAHKGWLDAPRHERWVNELWEISAMLHGLAAKVRSLPSLSSRPRP